MNIFDQILASAYYVFENELNSHIIRSFISLMRKTKEKFSRDDLKMKEISKYMEFKNHMYVLKEGYTIDDIAQFINFKMVTIFHNLKISRDKFYSNGSGMEEPNFEEAMKKVKRI